MWVECTVWGQAESYDTVVLGQEDKFGECEVIMERKCEREMYRLSLVSCGRVCEKSFKCGWDTALLELSFADVGRS